MSTEQYKFLIYQDKSEVKAQRGGGGGGGAFSGEDKTTSPVETTPEEK